VSLRPGAALALAVAAALLSGCGGSGETPRDLALVSTRDGDYAIFAMAADGSDQTRLSEPEGDEADERNALFFQIEPAWSPDGERLAFSSRRSGSFDIYSMSADGTDLRRLTTTKRDQDLNPTWSPDGRSIAFQRGQPGRIFVMKADGSGARQVTDDLAEESEPAWSPDGSWIVYSRRTPGTTVRELWLVRPDGSERHKLTSFGSAVYDPAWSPDSTRIVFAGDLDGEVFDIYSIGVQGKDLRRHTQSADDAFEPSWSPDGRTIAFARGGSIVTIDLQGNVEEITNPENNDSSPAWNPKPPAEADNG
jgi:Tol biopolymer transport system component